MTTEWPVEPGEEFFLTFHLHDTGDGVYDSEVIVDGLEFVGSVTPGTWSSYVPLAAGVRRSPVADELPVSSGPVRAAGRQLIRQQMAGPASRPVTCFGHVEPNRS